MRTVTYAIEIAVGGGCLGAAAVAWRNAHRWIAFALAAAGVLAIAHGVWAAAGIALAAERG